MGSPVKQASISSDEASAVTGAPIVLEGVCHAYGSTMAVEDVSLEIESGELVTLLGPSGCGKSTLLRIVAGFLSQSRGRLTVGGRVLDGVPPNRREVGIVFQNYALFPHMTVSQNIAYGLAARGASRSLQRERVAEMLAVVQMGHLGDRKPAELSGGQQQRVALARALAVRPRVLLLDEPFAALDKNLRLDMQVEIKKLQQKFALTTILVTHDQEEAMSISDRIAVMNNGRVEQFGSPVEIYDKPRTLFVNNFIGSSNLLPGLVESHDGEVHRVRLDAGAVWHAYSDEMLPTAHRVLVSVRPEQLTLEQVAAEDRLHANLELAMPIGGFIVQELRCADGSELKVMSARHAESAFERGAQVHCGPSPAAKPLLFLDDPSNEG